MIERILRWAARLARHHYRLIFLAAAVLVVLSVLSASRLRFDTEILNLLPANDPVVANFRSAVEDFGTLDFLLVVVRVPEGEVVDPYLDFIDVLGPELEALPEIEYVDYGLGGLDQLIEELFPRAFLFLDEEGRRQLAERLSDTGIQRRVEELRRQISLPHALTLRSLLQLDPLGVSEIFLDRITETRGALKIDWTTGYFLSGDHRLALLIAKPVRPAMEADFGRRLLPAVERVVAEVQGQWQDIAGPWPEDAGPGPEDGGLQPPPPPVVDLGGSYVTVIEDAGNMVRDVAINIVTALVGVLVLFVVAFRRLSLVGYAFLPLAFGLVVGFGFAGVVFGELSVATSGFAALLLGLGIDFVIVSYGRYVEERQLGNDLRQSLIDMAGTSGRAVVTGAITTAATFYAFAVTDFSGLRQMGLLTGTGILFCMVSVLVLLPALLAWSDDRRRRTERMRDLHLHAFGLGRLVTFSLHHPRPILISAGLLTVLAAIEAPRLRFEDNIRNMRPEGSRGVAIQTEVAEAFGSSLNYMMMVLRGDSEDEVRELADRTERAARELAEQGVLGGAEGLGSLMPSPSRQRQALLWLEQNASLLDAARIEQRFAAAAAREGLRPSAFAHGLELLAQAGSAREPITVSDLQANPQTGKLVRRYFRLADQEATAVVYLSPPSGGWGRRVPPELRTLAAELGPGAMVTGTNAIGERLRNKIRVDAAIATAVGFVLVALLLWLEYRSVRDTVLSLLPLTVGILWMLGAMVLLGLDMNFFNVFVATMIIGIGVDYGIHMVNRFRETGELAPERREAGLHETGRAVVIAALSTCVGFGSLSLSHYPGLRSMGIVAILGATATALVAVTVLPALLGLLDRPPSADPASRQDS